MTPELARAITSLLAAPRSERERARLGKGKLHQVYALEHAGERFVIKVRGRATPWRRLINWYKGVRHFAVTGEITRRRRASIAERWANELACNLAWRELGLPAVEYLPWPEDRVRVMRHAGCGTLAEHLRDPEHDLKFKLFSLMEVAGIMFARHTMVAATSDRHLFHEEPHTGNLLYRPGQVIYFDQEFLPDESRPDIHHAAAELVALAQSAIRDVGYDHAATVVAAIAHGYPDPAVLETAARLLDIRRPRWRWLFGESSPLPASALAALFRAHTAPEPRQRPAERPTPLGMPGDLSQRPRENPLG